jgi:hypothetical protein
MIRKSFRNLTTHADRARYYSRYWSLPVKFFLAVLTILVPVVLGSDQLQAQTSETAALRLPDARVGEDYVLRLRADGATGSTVWRVSSSTSLPPGITLDSATGELHIRPITARIAPYQFTIEAAETATSPALFSQAYLLTVKGPIRSISITAPASMVSSTTTQENPCESNEPENVESNSDSLSIAVRNDYLYDPDVPDGEKVINLKDTKKPVSKPEKLIGETLGKCYKWQQSDYVVVHLVKWPEKDPPLRPGNPTKYEVVTEKWFLYRNTAATADAPIWNLETVQEGGRIYGRRRVAVLLVHLTARDSWDIKYTVAVKGKIPGPVQNAIDLAGIVIGGAALVEGTPRQPSYWGGRLLLIKDLPADLAVKSDIVFLPSGEVMAGLRAEGEEPDPNKQTQQPKNYSKVFDNEGRYHWDVSVGIPVKSFKEVQYDVEGNQVTAKEVNRQNAYGFLNLFLNPGGVDTKGAEFYKTPHLVLGVPISGKPLDRPMVGLGIGFYNTSIKFNLFAGAVFNRVREPQTLGTGQTATGAELDADLRTKRVTKFIFGFNIPVGQFMRALKPKS